MGFGILPLLPADLMSAVLLALEGISSWFAPMHWLLVLVVRSWKTGGSGLIFLSVPSLGWELGLLRFRLLEPFLLLLLRVGLTILIGLGTLCPSLFRVPGKSTLMCFGWAWLMLGLSFISLSC